MTNYLEVSFPEISKSIHTKRIAYQILDHQKRRLVESKQQGQLEDHEYREMKRFIDRKVGILNNLNPKWELPSLMESVYKDHFKMIPADTFRKLIRECREESFGKYSTIFREGERANEAMILIRGAGTEYTNRGYSRVAEKRVRGDLVPMYVLVAPSTRYLTSK